jgi:hypothetical protein
MNAHDSERIKGLLEDIGLGEATSDADADVVVFNTCTIREKPDQRLAAHLAQAKALKAADPGRVIAVGGCYAEAQRERIFELYPFVDVAFGPGSIAHLGDWLGAGGAGVARGRFGLDDRAFAAQLPMHRERPFQAWVQVEIALIAGEAVHQDYRVMRAVARRGEQQGVQAEAVRGNEELLIVARMRGIAGRIGDWARRCKRRGRRAQGKSGEPRTT